MNALALLETFIRSFFLQTLWNFERMQNVGFAFAIAPLLRRLKLSKESHGVVLRRQLVFFNTHPYFALIAMGVVYQKEKSRPNAQEEDPTIAVLKNSMGGAFGAIGDHVMWGTWRPFCAVLAMAIGMLVAYPQQAWALCAQWWIVGFLTLFNSVHLWLRWRGLRKGVADGPLVVKWVESLHLQVWAEQVRRIGLLLIAAMVMIYLAHWRNSSLLLWMFAVLLGTVVVKRWTFSGPVIFFMVVAVALVMSFLGIHAL